MDSFGGACRAARVLDVFQEDYEFVSAETGQGIARSYQTRNSVCRFLEKLVPPDMAETIID